MTALQITAETAPATQPQIVVIEDEQPADRMDLVNRIREEILTGKYDLDGKVRMALDTALDDIETLTFMED